MKLTSKLAILAAAVIGFTTMSMQAEAKSPYDMCPDSTLFPAAEGDYKVKIHADEKLGLQWYMEAAAGFWSATGTETNTPRPQGTLLIHGQVAKRIVKSSDHSGLWIRAEIAGSLGIDSNVRRTDNDFNTAMGSFTTAHADYMGGQEFVLPEIVLTQFFNKDRAVLNFGVINLTNYFDAVGIANCTFSSFTNSGFVNSTVLPLVDSNLGAVFSFQICEESWFMVGAARTVTEPGYNPFRSNGRGAAYVGEYGRSFADGKGTFRLNPFMSALDVEKADGTVELEHNYGLAGSVEYNFGDRVSVFARAGFSARSEYGTDNDFSVGAHVRPFAARENDYFGVAFGMFKPGDDAETTANGNHEKVVELMYNFSVTDRLFIVPHAQFIIDPAGNDATDSEILWGVQAVFNF